MDNTETFIKMSDCPEIQGGVINDDDYIVVTDDTQMLYSGLAGFHKEPFHSPVPVKITKLPRQDQLQKMVWTYFLENFDIAAYTDHMKLLNLTGWIHDFEKHPVNYYVSMEQLWLAFVMRERFQKQWSGSEWVASC